MLFVLFFCVIGFSNAFASQAYDKVNSFIATGGLAYGYGGINPGAQYPFGALRLGPDTTYSVGDISWRHFSGYHYQDTHIRAFSHLHLVGGGVNDLGSVGVMPFSATKKLENVTHDWWWSEFSKSTETASPGFYSVYLDGPKVKAEMMAIGTLAGVHRYTWNTPSSGTVKPSIVIDMCHDSKIEYGSSKNRCLDASLTVDEANPNIFTGHQHTKDGLSGNLTVFIYAEFVPNSVKNNQVKSWKMCSQTDQHPSCEDDVSTKTAAEHLYGVASFDHIVSSSEHTFTIELRIGISFISSDFARKNLEEALSETKNYDLLAKRTKAVWTDALSYLSIETMPEDSGKDTDVVLYSASYRTLMSPTNYTESGGYYLGIDRHVHNTVEERSAKYGISESSRNQYSFFSDFSFWDTFRSLHPYLFLVDEELTMALARSITDITIQQNAFPRWVLGAHEASCMNGEHGAALIIEMILAGMGMELDIPSIHKIFSQQLTQPWPVNGRTDLDRYLSEGYVSEESSDKAASLTLGYYFDDYLLGMMSNFVNDSTTGQAAFERSQRFSVLWNSTKHIFCPKYVDGGLLCPETPIALLQWKYYSEGDALHYAWFVPHDPEGLVKLYSSPDEFNANLESFMSNHVIFHEKFGSSVPNPYYWAGNEHNFLAPWLFNVGSNCTNTQYWTRRLTYMHFSNTPHGIPGNEDYGSMSTWLLFASIGLYPQAGTSRFFIGSPRIISGKIRLHHWNRTDTYLEIVTVNNSPENVYVDKLFVNGKEWLKPFIDRSDLTHMNVKLEFYMHSDAISSLCQSK